MARRVGHAIRNAIQSIIQLLDRTVTDNRDNNKHQQEHGITVANTLDISCYSTYSRMPLTAPLR